MPEYLAFEVSLVDVEPRVWRSFLIVANATFADLHQAIQDACGWQNSHLFVFRDAGGRKDIAGVPDREYGDRYPEAKKVKVAAYFAQSGEVRCQYEYDFGDCWLHEVELKDRVILDDAFKRRLTGGERAFPPEDCGGIDGYARRVAFVRDGHHPWGDGDKELAVWLGDWKPEQFNLVAAKRAFDRPRQSRREQGGGREAESGGDAGT